MRLLKEYIAKRNNKYSIRKFTVGTASVLVGSILFMNQTSDAKADVIEKEMNSTTHEGEVTNKHNLELNQTSVEKPSNFNNKVDNVNKEELLSKDEEENKKLVKPKSEELTNDVSESKNNRSYNNDGNKREATDTLSKDNTPKEEINENIPHNDQTTIQEKEITIYDESKKDSPTQNNASNSSLKSKIHPTIKNETINESEQKYTEPESNNDKEKIKGDALKDNTISSKKESDNESTDLIDIINEIKEDESSKPKVRMRRSLNRFGYTSSILSRFFGNRIMYDLIVQGDNLTKAFREVERNRSELTEEERKLFLRNIIRQSALKNNRSAYDRVFDGDYSLARNIRVTAHQASLMNELLYKMKDLTLNRDNNDYGAVYTFGGQSDVTKNKFGIVKDDVFYDDGEILIATMVLEKEKGRGTYRFENYAIRPNESLSKKIKKVVAVYNGRQRMILKKDKLGYYSYTRPNSGSNGNPNTGGGSGGRVEFIISFDANYYIDVKKDKLFGYILSDTLDPFVLRGVNITNQAVDIDEVATSINNALNKAKKQKAMEAIQIAEQAKHFAEQQLSKILQDGVVNPSEKKKVDEASNDLEQAKQSALNKLNSILDGTDGKDELQRRFNQIGSVTSPEVNDQDSNGVLDTEQLTEAQQAIEAAEQAKQAVDNKLSEITSDGLINPKEKAKLDKLIEALETAKTNATEKLNSVPNGTEGKDALQSRLDQIGSVTSPEVNDQDSNGVLDTEQLTEAQQAIEAAEQAKQAADNKLSEVTSDGLINPTEKAELDKLIEALETAKTNATEKLNNVPNGTEGKDALQSRLDQIGTVTSPEVNDQDSNGVLDTEQLTEAQQAIEAAEQAKQVADNKLFEITSDGLVNPTEKAELDKLVEALETAKTITNEKLNNVPNGTTGKDALQNRLDQIGSVTSPEVNDQDGNGVLDTEQLTEAQQAIEAAEQAKVSADNKLSEVTSDGLITPTEKAELDKLVEGLEAAKVTAAEKLNNVPNGTAGKDALQSRLEQIGSVMSPEVNDQDSNGVLDTEQLSEAQQAIEAVEQAKVAANNKLSEITSDGLINPKEKAELDKLVEGLEAAKVTATEKLNNVPDGTAGKDELQSRLDQIGSVTSPEVNDQDSNGVLDTEQLNEAQQAIEASEQAKVSANNKLSEITSDGLITPTEKAELDKLIETLEMAKTNATEKLNNVPNGTAGKDALQSRLDQIGSVTSPEVNDQDGNGVLDTEQLTEAQQAIEVAEQAKQAVDNKLSEITADGLVNPTEKAELDKLIETLETAKTNATEKLNNVPNGTAGKDALQSRLNQIGSVTSPEVNDQDSNGVLDTEQLNEAQQAIEAVEQAKQAVDNKLSEITSDGLINPTEKEGLDKLVEALETAKTNATEKLNNVPNGTAGKDALQSRLDQIASVTSPEVNDQDSNGVLDTEQLSEAQQAIEAAEQAKQAVDNKLSEITSDGLINPKEKAELDKLVEGLEVAKVTAAEKLNNVPNGTEGKDELQSRLDQIGSVTSPEVNDQDSNGVLDTEQLTEAQQAIEALEQAKQSADNKLSEVTSDGLINPKEKAELDKLVEVLETAKTNATEKLNNVPNGTAGKDALQSRLEQIGSVTSPEVNDQDSNGVLDTEQLTEAQQAIEAVEQAKQAVDNKLSEITSDGLVNPTEKAELDKLVEALETAKTNATEKLNNVPNGTTGKDELQSRLEQIGSVTSPEVNDQDSNGVLDTEQLNEAQQAIEAAEQAKQAADNKLSEITADGLVNPTEKAELDKLVEALETAKTNATERLNNVPNGTEGKDELQSRLDQIGSVTSPEVNDQDSNGVLDTEQLTEAQQAIEALEQAKQSADNKLSEVTSDGLINPKEKAELDKLVEVLETAKTNATEKLNNVPNGTAGKDALQSRLEQIGSVTSPEVNDQDSNGVLDTEQLNDAQQAIEAAEQAKVAANNKLSEITSDGLVNPKEKAELDKLVEALETAKTNATEKLNNVPNGTEGKDELQSRLDQIGSVTSPEVNDQDSNGVLDTEQLTEAQQAIEALEQAKQSADNKLSEVTSDGLINPKEKAELDKLVEVLETAKTNATEKLNNVPNGTAGKDALQSRLEQIGSVTSPEVNDQDSNGVLDTEQLNDAQQAIEAAEQAKVAANNKLSEITSDGLVNPTEKAELDKLVEALETAKTNATEKLNNVPNGTIGKEALQSRLDQIGSVMSPEVNDQDSNGTLDVESPNIKGQNHAKVNKHLDNAIKNSKTNNPMHKNVKEQYLNDRDSKLLEERPPQNQQQLNGVSNHLQIMKNETNENSKQSMKSLTHLPNTGGKNKDSWIFGTLLGAIGSMMLLRRKQEKR
ncbi:YSIRK-type signal peptide-containing protein [Staphylococcus sp. KG4-1]|nr:YSIRK-type signal peptide-containing protein [Staphylococcus sp. KG4-1]